MKIAIVTGSRADLGPLEMVFRALTFENSPYHMNQHDICWIDVTPIALPVYNDEAVQMAASAASKVSSEPPVDLIIVHGDRYEILGAVMGANMMGVPIAHLAGGDVTVGSPDDCYRHAITKLSHLHFPNTVESANRIIQMGEDPERVHMVGDPAVDRILKTPLLGREETFRAVGLQNEPRRALVVLLHPTPVDTALELAALIGALKAIAADTAFVLLGPNADPGNKTIELAWQLLASARPNTVYRPNLPGEVFLSLLKHCDAMVGNSSAGFYEAPLFGLPVVNIGERQLGRKKYVDSISSDAHTETILSYINHMMKQPKAPIETWGDGHAAERIANIIGNIKDPKSLLRKRFQTLDILGRCSPTKAMGYVP